MHELALGIVGGGGTLVPTRLDVPVAVIILGAAAVGTYVGFRIGGGPGAAAGALVGAAVGGIACGLLKRLTVVLHPDGRLELRYETIFD